MILKKISLYNFMNYEKEECEFDDNINILIGENAQGKSNLLESIYFISTINSSRKHKDKDLIKWGRDSFSISAHFLNRMGENKVDINYEKNKKEVFINNYKIEKRKEYIGFLTTILFTPEDLYIIKGDPSSRRTYMDNELIATDVEYFLTFNKYKKIIDHRNNLLKEAYRGRISDETMDVWEEQLVKHGTIILSKRIDLINKLKIIAAETHDFITDKKENLEIEYNSKICLDLLKEDKKDKFIEFYKNCLKEKREEDIERGYTGIGPHRDDLDIKVNNISLKKFGSQGQQRTAALSLKIAEIEFVKDKIGEYPILLLDDVLSELDKKRKNKLLSKIENKVQTIITTTELNDIEESLKSKGKIINIENGKVI